MKSVSATLHWMRPSDGGLQAPPAGPRYSRPARFAQQREAWSKEAWSLVVEWTNPPDSTLTHQVTARFLVEGAPDHLLATGNRFELLEGDHVVAVGVVL